MKKEFFLHKKGYRIDNDGVVLNPKGKLINGSKSSMNYLEIGFKINNIVLKCSFHRLQAFQKYGMDLYKAGIEVRHLDGDRLNNSWDNIAIGTHSDNMMDIPKHIRIANSLHASSFNKKYDYLKIKEFHKNNGNSYKKTMNEFNISSKGSLNYILKK